MRGSTRTILPVALAMVLLCSGRVGANDNPALGVGEPNVPAGPPPPPPCTGQQCDQCKGSSSPVYAHSGQMYQVFEDLSFRLQTPPFGITRVYHSDDFYVGLFGRGFVSTLDMMSIATSRGNLPNEVLVVRWPDGQRSSFTRQPDGRYSTPVGRYETLAQVAGGYTLSTPQGVVYAFDNQARLQSITDRNGREVSIAYDAASRPSAVTLFGNRTITINYHASGFVQSITDYTGRTASYEYDDGGYLITFVDASGAPWGYEYDDGRLARIRDPLGRLTLSVTYDGQGNVQTIVNAEGDFTYTYNQGSTFKKDNSQPGNVGSTHYYDSQGVVTRITDAFNKDAVYTYNSLYQLTSQTDRNSVVTAYTYDAAGNLLSLRVASNFPAETATWQYTYDPVLNQVLTATDPVGVITRYEYDAKGNLTSLTEALGTALQRVTRYTYDVQGNRITITDANNQTTQYTYDSAGYMTQETGPDGVITKYTYDAQGRLMSMTEAFGTPLARTTSHTYDALDHLLTTTLPGAATTTAVYDAAGHLADTSDERGKHTTYVHDAYGRLTQQTDPPNNAVQYSYDPAGRVLTRTDGRGGVTSYTLDKVGQTASRTDALNKTTMFTYDSVGNLLSETDPLNRTTSYQYNKHNFVTRTTYADTRFTTQEYDLMDRLRATVDELGRRTQYSYDALGRRTRITNPLNQNTDFEYDPLDRLIREINVRGLAWLLTYDADGNLLTDTDPASQVETRTYDTLDRITTLVNRAGVQSTYQYDIRDRLTAVVRSDGGLYRREYDRAGNCTAQIDPLSRRTEIEYDDAGRRVKTRFPDNSTILWMYDANGNVLTVTDPDGNVTTSTYDAQDRLLTRKNALNAIESFAYDDAGNLTQATDRRGRVINYFYDLRDRRTRDTWDNAYQINFTYDAVGNLLTATAADTAVTFTYDALNRLLTSSNAGAPGGIPQVTLTYVYGPGTLNTLTDSLGRQLAWQYDNADRISQIAETGTGVNKTVNFGYNGVGAITLINRNRPGVPNTQAVYNTSNRLTGLTHGGVASYTHAYDLAGNPTQITDAGGAHVLGYDSRNRVTSVDHPSGNPLPDETYAWDANSNRTASHIHGSAYQTAADNRLNSDGAFNYQYDANGNLIQRTEITTGQVLNLTYDHRNRLTRAQTLQGLTTVSDATYTYDGLDRIITRVFNGTAQHYFYDGKRRLLVTDHSGNALERYLPAPGTDLWLAAQVGGTVQWYLTDALSTVRDVVDNNGVLLNHLAVDSFGRVVQQTNPAQAPRFGLWGAWMDAALPFLAGFDGYYEPSDGRLVQPGTLGRSEGNPYVPFRTSPLGQATFDIAPFLLTPREQANGETWCDPASGDMKTTINNTGADKSCTEEHEADHRAYRGACCKKLNAEYAACKDQACKNTAITKWNDYTSQTSNYSECRAHKVGKKCREKLLKDKECDKCPASPSTDAEKALKKACDEIKTGLDSDKSHISSRCPGTNKPCPF